MIATRKSNTDPVDHREANVATLAMDFLHERDTLAVLEQLTVVGSIVSVAAGGWRLVWLYAVELIGFDLDVLVDHL